MVCDIMIVAIFFTTNYRSLLMSKLQAELQKNFVKIKLSRIKDLFLSIANNDSFHAVIDIQREGFCKINLYIFSNCLC